MLWPHPLAGTPRRVPKVLSIHLDLGLVRENRIVPSHHLPSPFLSTPTPPILTAPLEELSPMIEDLPDTQITSFFKMLPPGTKGKCSH